jgi:protein SCO1/2
MVFHRSNSYPLQIFALILLLIFLWPGQVCGQTETRDKPPEVGILEHLDEFVPNATFIDLDSSQVRLLDLINKPTIISFVYFNCPGLCSPLLDGIAEVIEKTDLELGADYQVITISFNPEDKPSLGRSKKKNYTAQVTTGANTKDHWIWLTGDSLNIQTITNAMGFHFKREGKEFAHSAAIMFVSPEGKITRYLYGTYFLPFDVKLAAIEASEERSSPTINKVLKFCFSYDAEGRKYVFNINKITGAVVLSGALIFFLTLVLKKRGSTNSDKAP